MIYYASKRRDNKNSENKYRPNKHYENKCKNNFAVAIYCVATTETT